MTLTYVVPDIHGMHSLLVDAISEIDRREPNGGHTVVFLGDYIDRGPMSAQVVETIRSGISDGKPWVAIKGNHEDFMASAIADGDKNMGLSWLMNGGREAVASYSGDEAWIKSDAEWMAALPAFHEDAHRVYVHAFAPEQYDLSDAPEHVMLWTRYPVGADVGYRGKHVVHGHTPQRNGPELLANRTNLDCGAVFYGRLVVGVFASDRAGGPSGTIEFRGSAA